jgi:dihydroxy-acid dehydratase
VLLDLKPSGQHYMEDFHAAGGMATLLRELKPLLKLDAPDRHRPHAGRRLERAPAPFSAGRWCGRAPTRSTAKGGLAVLQGNLAPGGAIIKQSAAAALMEHEGRAVVFDDAADLAARIDSDDLDVAADDVLVLKNIGPKGAPGMPEAGACRSRASSLRQGVKDMVRISDGRMSGTAFGTVVLHVTPESAVGGPAGPGA